MTKEAELHAEEDRKKKESVESKNQLDSTIYQLEKTLKESGDKISSNIKSKAESALAEAKKELESNDTARMKSAMEKLSAVGGELYQEAQKAAQASGGAPEAGQSTEAPKSEPSGKKTEKKADVVDADFEVVDEDKKK
jgi:molecular chaperone DnaK